jgi:two-component system chemotaxis sensor kinase CheA
MSDDVIREFLIESYEGLDRLETDLVALEKDPHDSERLATTFRTIHSIKGVCGFLAFHKLESIAHVGESLLSKMRDSELVLDRHVATGLLRMVDATREILAHIELDGNEPDADYGAIVAELESLIDGSSSSATQAEIAVAPATLRPFTLPEADEADPAQAMPDSDARDERRSGDERRIDDRRVEDRRGGVSDTSLRVDVSLLDKLMNLVGELVLARNQILQFTTGLSNSAVTGATQRLNLVTSELQEGVMKTRMQPIGNIWAKFPRVVRDIATQCGKQVRVEMEGKETELDKTIIEAIKDPLTHIVRNSVDHGIEAPEVRRRLGKPVEGMLRLRAFHEGGQINIEISDDGAGIDPAAIRIAAAKKGLISADAANRMTDHEAIRLIFLPGFSTAERVSNLSGRGVGMDVVKTNIEKIGGQVDMQSRIGVGTVLRIKIPLTLAIIPALVVTEADGARYAIPQVSLLELVRLDWDHAATSIERIQDAPFYRLRGNLLPLLYLDRELAVGRVGPQSDAINIVVLKADERQFGLIVHAINDTEEIVVKPLGKQLKGVGTFAGATIMGDGTVALILDVLGLAQHGGIVSTLRDHGMADGRQAAVTATTDGERQTLLLFSAGGGDRMAIPLSQVARLEEFPAHAIEYTGGRELVQYRGQILPLVRLDAREESSGSGRKPCQVIVFNHDDQYVGLVVDAIVDIVTEHVVVEGHLVRPGVLGTAIVQQKVTELVDVHAILSAVVGYARPRVAA